jgi:hypothetical protein
MRTKSTTCLGAARALIYDREALAMSMELHVFLRNSSIPTTEQRQQAIRDADFDSLGE